MDWAGRKKEGAILDRGEAEGLGDRYPARMPTEGGAAPAAGEWGAVGSVGGGRGMDGREEAEETGRGGGGICMGPYSR